MKTEVLTVQDRPSCAILLLSGARRMKSAAHKRQEILMKDAELLLMHVGRWDNGICCGIKRLCIGGGEANVLFSQIKYSKYQRKAEWRAWLQQI